MTPSHRATCRESREACGLTSEPLASEFSGDDQIRWREDPRNSVDSPRAATREPRQAAPSFESLRDLLEVFFS